MNYQDIVRQLCAILTPLAKQRVDVTEDTELTGELGLDSLRVMDMLLSVEDQFDISIPVNVLSDVHTVRDLALQIQQRVDNN